MYYDSSWSYDQHQHHQNQNQMQISVEGSYMYSNVATSVGSVPFATSTPQSYQYTDERPHSIVAQYGNLNQHDVASARQQVVAAGPTLRETDASDVAQATPTPKPTRPAINFDNLQIKAKYVPQLLQHISSENMFTLKSQPTSTPKTPSKRTRKPRVTGSTQPKAKTKAKGKAKAAPTPSAPRLRKLLPKPPPEQVAQPNHQLPLTSANLSAHDAAFGAPQPARSAVVIRKRKAEYDDELAGLSTKRVWKSDTVVSVVQAQSQRSTAAMSIQAASVASSSTVNASSSDMAVGESSLSDEELFDLFIDSSVYRE